MLGNYKCGVTVFTEILLAISQTLAESPINHHTSHRARRILWDRYLRRVREGLLFNASYTRKCYVFSLHLPPLTLKEILPQISRELRKNRSNRSALDKSKTHHECM